MTERENEKELILGNSQLISLFFVVVALCGVFFALGYMIGRNSTKQLVATGESAAQTGAAQPPAAARAPEPAREMPSVEPPRAGADAPPPPSEPAPSVTTQPAREMPTAAPPKETARETAKEPPPAAKPAPTAAATALPALETGASYLQVAALRRDDAAKLVRTLREQDLPARLAESPKPEMFRVLVGPYHQTAEVAEAKTRLKTLGFANAFVQRQ
jgi:cell division septation protein DedD